MTQHILQEDTHEDQQTMRRLATVIGGFIVATAVMAVVVGLVMG
jgi:hypothetical protein